MSDVRYARNGDVHLAYKVLGEGPVTLMLVPMWFSNLDLLDQHPEIAKVMERISSVARVILWDRRGSGLSDRMCGPATLEEGMDDLIAVLDAAGASNAALFGFNEAGTLCALAAATHPQRISGLVLYGSYAATTWHPDYPWGQTEEERKMQVEWIKENWGSEEVSSVMVAGSDKATVEWGKRWQTLSLSPDALPHFYETLSKTDVRAVLPSIRVPTLVLHRKDDVAVPVDNGRYLAASIPGSRYVELEGYMHVPFLSDWDQIQGEIEEFLTGERRSTEPDRVLATILFTDIVGSTEQATRLGDAEWRKLLDVHDGSARRHIQTFGGELVKTTGDGLLATFDGPARAIRCAAALRDDLKGHDLELRAGVHTGEVEVRGNDIGGIAVHIGARVLAIAKGGEVLVSPSVPPLVAGSGLTFEDRGLHELRGVEGAWNIYAVVS